MLVEKPYGRESNCEDGCCPMVEDAFLALAEDGKPLPRGLEGESTNDFLACHVKRVYLPAEATP